MTRDINNNLIPSPPSRDLKGSSGQVGPSPQRVLAKRELPNAKTLHQASMEAKKMKSIKMDCRVPEQLVHVESWLQANRPSEVRKADGVGKITMIGPGMTKDEEESEEEYDSRRELALQKWERLTGAPDVDLTYQDVKDLAAEFELLGGKWMLHVNRKQVTRRYELF